MTTNELEALAAGGLQGKAGWYADGDTAPSSRNDGWLPEDRGRPFYGTRLGLERTHLSDGRSLVRGRLVGRRLG